MAFIPGTEALDNLSGTDYADDMPGFQGDDTLKGGKGNDTIEGGKGNDRLSGEQGQDLISGGLDRDWIRGGALNDTLWGDRNYWEAGMSTDGLLVIDDPNDGVNNPYSNTKARYRDTFYFESNAFANGIDMIKDLDVITAGGLDAYGTSSAHADARFDTLDLCAALGSKTIKAGNVANYVRIKLIGSVAHLQLDTNGLSDGIKLFATFAVLNKFQPLASGTPNPDGSSFVANLVAGDQVFVDTGSYQGLISCA